MKSSPAQANGRPVRFAVVLLIGLVALLLGASAEAGPPVCGDGVRAGNESCDGSDFDAQTCADYGCAGGALVCTSSCDIDSSGCTDCGGGGNAAGTVELLFTERSDDVSESNISAQEQRLLDLLDGETVSIKASIDGLGRANVVDRLISAHNRGVVVQVIADCKIVVVDQDPEYLQLIAAGIPVVDDNSEFDSPTAACTNNQTSGFLHNKFFLFGAQETVWTGSTNMTDFGFNSSHNTIVILAGNPEVVSFYTAEFGEMFGDGVSLRDGGSGRFGRQKTLNPGVGSFTLADGSVVEVSFSPYNYNTMSDTEAQINATIDSASGELLWGTFFLTYDAVRDRIANNSAASKRGAVDPQTTDNYDDTQILITGGEDVLVTNLLGSHHAKMVVADPDDATGQVLVGSHNFSNSSFNYNNENSVRILSPAIAQIGRAGFDAIWNDSQNTGLVGCIHSGESYNDNSLSLHRCNDAYDNDFDGATDGADADCAQPFTCGGGGSCKAAGENCSDGAECCSGTCYHGQTRTCA
jgi:hypothetical protein